MIILRRFGLISIHFQFLSIKKNPFTAENQDYDLTEYTFRLRSRHYQLLFKYIQIVINCLKKHAPEN